MDAPTLALMNGDTIGDVDHRNRPSNVCRAIWGDVTQSDDNNTPGDIAITGRGLNETYMVGAAGFEPATARV